MRVLFIVLEIVYAVIAGLMIAFGVSALVFLTLLLYVVGHALIR